jgi:hypothetical protein
MLSSDAAVLASVIVGVVPQSDPRTMIAHSGGKEDIVISAG